MHETPALVAEVLSDSTRQNDLTYKRELYHRQGVEAYLIVDPATKIMTVDRPQADGRYVSENATSDVSIKLCKNCELSVQPPAVFGRPR